MKLVARFHATELHVFVVQVICLPCLVVLIQHSKMTEVAVITGCASGIGKALALEMHSRRLADGTPAFKVYATDYR